MEITIAGDRYIGLVLCATSPQHPGEAPMLRVQWVGKPPRDFPVEYITEQGLRLVK